MSKYYYCCKYAPIELIAGFSQDEEMRPDFEFLLPTARGSDFADSLVYPSICSYARSVLESLDGERGTLLLTDCCDAMKRIGDAADLHTDMDIYMLNLPRFTGDDAASLYADEMLRIIKAYEKRYNIDFDLDAFTKACLAKGQINTALEGKPHVAIMGARVPSSVIDMANDLCKLPVVNLTCSSGERTFSDEPSDADLMTTLLWYAGCLLSQMPCMRMADIDPRKDLKKSPNLTAIIYHTIKFCDYYPFEYIKIHDDTIPVLKLETDFTAESSGQIETRLQALFENNGLLASYNETGLRGKPATMDTMKKNGLFAGIDIGSTSVNAVVVDKCGQIVAAHTQKTGSSDQSADEALNAALDAAAYKRSDVACVFTTGYGRKSVSFEHEDITEITCHARGARRLMPGVRTVIDIGGQDSKVILLDVDGNVTDFFMNDKCAAGTGRFIELMADTLGLSLDELALRGQKWHTELNIASMCAVFAESEVISLKAEGKDTGDIIHAVNTFAAGKAAAMAIRMHFTPPVIMTGGVAKNKGVVNALASKLNTEIFVPQDPQIVGAYGAALFASDKQIG